MTRLRPRFESPIAAPSFRGASLPSLLICALSLIGVNGCYSGDRNAIPVTLSVQRETPNVAKATVLVDYSRAAAKIAQEDGHPACAFILPGLTGEFADDGRGILTIHMLAARGVRGPADIVACRMIAAKADTEPAEIAARLDVKLTEAEDGGGKVVDLAAASVTLAPPTAEANAADAVAAPTKGPTQKSLAEANKERLAAAAAARRAAQAAAPPATAAAAGTASRPAATVTGSITRVPTAAPVPARAPAAPTLPYSRPPAPSAGQGAVLMPSAGRNGQAPTDNAAAGSNDNQGQDQGTPTDGGNHGNDPDPCRDDPSAPLYDVTFSVSSAGTLGSLQFQALYNGSCGGWQGRSGDVECESLVNAMAAFNAPSGNNVNVALVNAQAQGIRLGDVAKCTFRSPDYTSGGSFVLTLVDAADTNSRQVSPPPTLSVSVRRR